MSRYFTQLHSVLPPPFSRVSSLDFVDHTGNILEFSYGSLWSVAVTSLERDMLCTTVYARCPADQVESVRSKLDAASSRRWDFYRHAKQTEAVRIVQGGNGSKLYLEGRRVPLYKDYNVRSRTIIEVGPTIEAFIEHVGLRVHSEEHEEGFAFARAALEAYLYKTKETQSWTLECEVMHDSPQEAIALIESILLPLSLSSSPHKPQ